MPQLNVTSRVTAFQDTQNVSDPKQRYVDWQRSQTGIGVSEVYSSRFEVDVGETIALLADVSVSAIGDTYTTKTVPFSSAEYQLRASAAALASLCTNLATIGQSYSVSIQTDGTIWLTYGGAADGTFSSVKPGDTIYLAGSQFNDTGPWNILNQGFWTVVRVESVVHVADRLVMLWPLPDPFAETITAAAVTDIQKVAPEKYVFLSGGPGILTGIHPVVHSAKGWVTIATSTSYPIATALSFTTFAVVPEYLAFARIESDQVLDIIFRCGDATDQTLRVLPVSAGDVQQMGWAEVFGFVTKLSLLNNSGVAATVNVVYAVQE